ncbi:MAG: sugar phosphate nucleotidyltransferase [Vicinamibacterales bacterium]
MIDTALILAAGLGTRLAPLSSFRAKAALPVAGEALIRRQIRWLAASGVTRVVVNLHHRPATITAALGHGDDLGVAVAYSWEPTVLGSAGGPARALDLLARDRFFVVNGDTLTNLDLDALAAAHAATRPLVTMAASPTVPDGYNALLADADGRWQGVRRAGTAGEAAAHAGRHFVGVQVAERAAFAAVAADRPSEILHDLYPRLTAADPGSVRVWTSLATFRDVQTPADYLDTARAVAAAEGRALDRGARTTIADTAQVADTVCWDDVVVAAGADLAGCVVVDGAHVPAGLGARDACLVPRAGYAAGAADLVVGDLVVVPFARPTGRPG